MPSQPAFPLAALTNSFFFFGLLKRFVQPLAITGTRPANRLLLTGNLNKSSLYSSYTSEQNFPGVSTWPQKQTTHHAQQTIRFVLLVGSWLEITVYIEVSDRKRK